MLDDGTTKILFDPGGFSEIPELSIDAIVITHVHLDHAEPGRIKALKQQNPTLRIISNTAVQAELAPHGLEIEVVEDGQTATVNSFTLKGIGIDHALIHPDVPLAKNTGYIVNDKILHPGDALTVPAQQIEVLLLPVVAPWSKVAETLDYITAVKPKIALPIHDGFLKVGGAFYALSKRWCEKYNTQFLEVENGKTYEI